MNRVFFNGLTEIRAIAALFVLFHHIELYKFRDGLPSLYDTPLSYFISHLGENGVIIFFVLSGF
jgi:peptidoglycan/LPS O-acetylase OafA/YrhL